MRDQLTDGLHRQVQHHGIGGEGNEAHVHVEPGGTIMERMDLDGVQSDERTQVCCSGECIEQQPCTESLAMQSNIDRKSSNVEHWDHRVGQPAGLRGGQVAALDCPRTQRVKADDRIVLYCDVRDP